MFTVLHCQSAGEEDAVHVQRTAPERVTNNRSTREYVEGHQIVVVTTVESRALLYTVHAEVGQQYFFGAEA